MTSKRVVRSGAAFAAIVAALSSPAFAQAQGEQAGEEIDGEIVVTGEQFNYNLVESAYKLPLSAKEIPQSIKILTPDLMEYARVDRFEDLYKVDAGAHPSFGVDGYARNYFRGFLADGNYAFKLDGMRAFGIIDLNFAAVERVEVIKGASSTLYGQAVIGGSANVVSKKPTEEFRLSTYGEYGTYDHFRGGVDVSGAVTGDGKLRARLVVDYLDENSHIDYYYKKSTVVAPSVQYAFSDDTSITILGNYQKDDFFQLGGFGAHIRGDESDPENYVLPDVPRSRLAGIPDSYNKRELYYIRGLFEHRFAGGWQFRAGGHHAKLDENNNYGQALLTHADGTTDIDLSGGIAWSKITAAEANLFGDFELFGTRNTIFVGADYYHSRNGWRSGGAWLPGSCVPAEDEETCASTGFSVFDPDYSLLPRARDFRDPRNYDGDPTSPFYNAALAALSPEIWSGAGVGQNTEYGATAQLILRPTDEWTILLGTRYSNVRSGRAFSSLEEKPGAIPLAKQTAWTYQIGTTYAITPSINAYASYGQSFVPRYNAYTYDPADPTGNGNPVGPERGRAYEIGFKGTHGNGAFAWSAALFDIARTNITQTDLEHSQGNLYYVLLLGKQRAKGLELDAQGGILPGWQVYASLSVMDNKFVEGEFKGYPAYFAPKAGFSLFSDYELQAGALQGLGFGGGIVYKRLPVYSSFYGDIAGQPLRHLSAGDILEADARLSYKRGGFKYSLSVTNLFNTKYYTNGYAEPNFSINVNPGRRFLARIGYEF